jgi:hypothetical protein
MKSNKTFKYLLTIGLIIGGVFSCKKNLNTSDPNVVITNDYFKNSAELTAATFSIYSTWHASSLVAREWFFLHDLRSDDVTTGGSQLEAPRNQILIGVVDPANPVMNAVWNTLYTVIHRANTVTDNAPGITDNNAVRDNLVGEAKFLRGWAYYELASMWGSVPIISRNQKLKMFMHRRLKI